MLGSIPAATSALESNPEGVVLLLLFNTVYVACMFFVFCWPLVFAALGSTSFSSLTLDVALLLPLNKSISPSEAPPTLFSAFKNTLICARCSSITFKYACEQRVSVFKDRAVAGGRSYLHLHASSLKPRLHLPDVTGSGINNSWLQQRLRFHLRNARVQFRILFFELHNDFFVVVECLCSLDRILFVSFLYTQ